MKYTTLSRVETDYDVFACAQCGGLFRHRMGSLRQNMTVLVPSYVVFTSSVEPEVGPGVRNTKQEGPAHLGVRASQGKSPARPPPDTVF